MASEPSQEVDAEEPVLSSSAPKPVSRRRRKKLIIAVVVIAVVMVVIIWGWSSTGGSFVEVDDLLEDQADYLNETVEVQGRVADWPGTGLEFSLVDPENPSESIPVVMQGTLPEGFGNGKDVVVTGELVNSPPLTILGTEITVGCASKY